MTYAYDAIGDITSKSDTGSYTYGATRPHAVTSISGANPGTYQYDADGNMTNRNGTVITDTGRPYHGMMTGDFIGRWSAPRCRHMNNRDPPLEESYRPA